MKGKNKWLSLFFALAIILTSLLPNALTALNISTDSINESHITAIQIKQKTDGLAPFDADNTAGNDANNANNIVRSFDNVNYTLVYQNFGNVYPSSNFWFNPINARFVKIEVLTPNSSVYEIEKNRTSIAEIEVYGVETDNIIVGETSGEVIVDKNQNATGSQGGVINLNQNNDANNGAGNSATGGTTGGSTDTDTNTEKDAAVDPEPVIPAIVIPEFYNYVWIIIAGGILLIAGGISLLIFALNKKKNKAI